jgi:hypothetical protein
VFGNKTAWTDFCGTLDLYHRALSKAVFTATGKTVRTAPLGTPGGSEWLAALQAVYNSEGQALGIAIPDLQSYDLRQAEDFASFTWTLSQITQSLRKAAGLS